MHSASLTLAHNALHSPSYSYHWPELGARAAGAGRTSTLTEELEACPSLPATAPFELGDQAIKVDFKRDQAIKGRF